MTNLKRGFTLIELLIVIAILAVLAVVVLVAVNPAQRQAQARDTGRQSSVVQLGRAIQTYYTSSSSYPSNSNWAQDLINIGELGSFPSGIAYNAGSNCVTFEQPGVNPTYCYDLDATNGAIVFSVAEAQKNIVKCTVSETPYFTFSTADSRGGTICFNGDPTPWAPGTMNYVD
jgi:prepilin-type N-terminal cleavage/methylation domain-containing protein